MELSEFENGIIMEVLPRLHNCEQIKLILNADFYPNREENNTELNLYGKNSLLYSLIYPYCKMFFMGHSARFEYKTIVDDLAVYLILWLQHFQYPSGFLSGVERGNKKVDKKD